MPELTIEDAKTWQLTQDAHYNGGRKFFAYSYRCVQQPRLTRYDRYDRKTRSVESTWRTDGIDRASLADAIAALNIDPDFSDEEIGLLITISEEPADRRKEMLSELQLWNPLREKGAIVWENRKVRRTELGTRALQATISGECSP